MTMRHGRDRKRSVRFDFGEFDEHCVKEGPDRAFTFFRCEDGNLHSFSLTEMDEHDAIRLEIITVPFATLATVNTVCDNFRSCGFHHFEVHRLHPGLRN